MSTGKPKIDIETLRIEITEDDLFTNHNMRTNKRYIWTLKDNYRVFAFGDIPEVRNFLHRMFGFHVTDLIPYQYVASTTFLKEPLMNYYNNLFQNNKNPHVSEDVLSFYGPITVHRDGWELAGIYSTNN